MKLYPCFQTYWPVQEDIPVLGHQVMKFLTCHSHFFDAFKRVLTLKKILILCNFLYIISCSFDCSLINTGMYLQSMNSFTGEHLQYVETFCRSIGFCIAATSESFDNPCLPLLSVNGLHASLCNRSRGNLWAVMCSNRVIEVQFTSCFS